MKKIFSFASIILGLIMALTPFLIFPVCDGMKPDGTPMNCFYSGMFIASMGLFVAIFSLTSMRSKLHSIFVIFSGACAVSAWLVPNGIIHVAGSNWACGLCANPEHSCRALTLPAVGVLAIVIVVLCVVALIFDFVKGDK